MPRRIGQQRGDMAQDLPRLDWPRLDWQRHAIFLDFDGTLAPIVPRPEQAAVSGRTREAVARMLEKTGGALAILSGRDLSDLDAKLAPLRPPAAASHGVVRRDGTGAVRRDEAAAGRLIAAVEQMEAFGRPRDLLIERKAGAVTVHYRNHPEAGDAARALVDDIVRDGEGLRAIHGNMVSEVAVAGANKGLALDAFMAEPPFAGRTPFVAGDDTTDEDAFEAAQGRGGLALKIGQGPSAARLRVPGIGDFLDWLHRASES
jgi:trehalose 6-phosphate phosphatase